ncbi:Uncharacterized protein NEOC65_001776 [Neochlamydia sp. AcF65]|uniref:L,D-transpeptidase n=1 Tax=Neochlamydia sp. AcF65 TaxID=2795735 RepID=UPI001BCA17AE|nr:L,D-transpeptidase [Neochlamydia sp. AcF65]MBS4166683.1 Uncharacterized protein [Neochlamydia sp. AcF65]
MTLPKLLIISAIILFSIIGVAALFKNKPPHSDFISEPVSSPPPIEIEINSDSFSSSALSSLSQTSSSPLPAPSLKAKDGEFSDKDSNDPFNSPEKVLEFKAQLPEENRVMEFFNTTSPKFPIVETITYKSRVNWQKGRPAWLSDYANHYKTSRHFIARSLNGKPDYLKQDVNEGARFNILHPHKMIHFHLLIDLSRCQMWFYYYDINTKEKVLVKTYKVGLGRLDPSARSGLLTPLGIYSLGSRVAVYSPKIMGIHQGAKVEMIRIFGTRWIPFEKELHGTTAPAKGLGIHGMPWLVKNGTLMEDTNSLSKYESDGCIRMAAEDIEELYSIIISRPTTLELTKDFFKAENSIETIIEIANK